MKTHTSLFRAACFLGALVSSASLVSAANPLSRHTDKSFVKDAAESGMEEVAISQIAAERATNPQVKDFATMMVTDHTGANTELTALATAKNLPLPAAEKTEHKWAKKKAGKDFDEDYMEKMVEDHKEAVELFRKEAKDGKDADLVAFAQKTLPTLEHHLQQAQDIRKMVK